jgi:hypothetical protein
VRNPPHRFVQLGRILASVGALWWSGCSTPQGSTEVKHYQVNVPATGLYRYGPAQSFGADYNLKQGQRVLMMKREFGFSRIMTEDGQSGYVATEDLAPAPPPPSPPKIASRDKGRRGSTRGGSSRSSASASAPSSANRKILQGAPLFDPGDLPPLPEADPLQPPANGDKPANPEKPPANKSKAKPGFRVNVPEAESKP